MSKKIAPELDALNRNGARVTRKTAADELIAALEAYSMAGLASCHPATVERALRQARALLAVARAAASDPDPHHRVSKALARLDRLSSGTGKRKGGTR